MLHGQNLILNLNEKMISYYSLLFMAKKSYQNPLTPYNLLQIPGISTDRFML